MVLALILIFWLSGNPYLHSHQTNDCVLSPQDVLDYEVDSDEEWEEEEPGESLSHSEGVSNIREWKNRHCFIATSSLFI